MPAVAREERRWKALASKIPDGPIRDDALSALLDKRGQTDGAAMFSILPRARNPSLLRLLVAYQIIWDFLDSVNERAPDEVNGRQLHLALVDALRPGCERADYYRHHPWRDDGGYLNALVDACRECCLEFPAYERVQSLVVQEARRAQVLALNHDLNPAHRNAALRTWALDEFPLVHEVHWFELSAACSAGLTIFALLTLACEPHCGQEQIERTHAAYFPWTSALACMLDSYADQAEDAANGDHSYISHYPTPECAVTQTCRLVHRCLCELHALPNGESHVLIACSMIALYLSKDSVLAKDMSDSTSRIAHAGGSLTQILLPILRLWRAAYSLRSS